VAAGQSVAGSCRIILRGGSAEKDKGTDPYSKEGQKNDELGPHCIVNHSATRNRPPSMNWLIKTKPPPRSLTQTGDPYRGGVSSSASRSASMRADARLIFLTARSR